MSWLDPCILLIVALSGFAGWRIGLVQSLVPLLSVFFSSAIAVVYGHAVSGAFHSAGAAAAGDGIGRLVILFAGTGLLWALFRWLVLLFLVARLSGPDRAGGLVAMLVCATIFSASFSEGVARIPLGGARAMVHGSALGGFFVRTASPAARRFLRSGAVFTLRSLEEPGPSPTPTPMPARGPAKTKPKPTKGSLEAASLPWTGASLEAPFARV